MRRRGDTMRPGDVYVLNAPYAGGTHLPDVTVVMPVFLASVSPPSSSPRAAITPTSAASRPGSMPSDSAHIDEEGVLLDNVQLVAKGVFLEAELRALLSGGRYPARNVEQNLADLRAQVAACQKGAAGAGGDGRALRLAGRAGLHAARAGQRRGSRAPRDRCAHGRRLRISRWTTARCVRVSIRIDKQARAASIDFTGTSAQQPNNFNAPVSGHARGRAVRVPHAGGRRDSDERRLPQAAADLGAGRLDAQSAVPGRSRRRQRRDFAGASPIACTARSACSRPARAR